MTAANASSLHDKDLRTLGEGVRVNIGVMVIRALSGDLEDRIEAALRAVRKRWDELAPPSTSAIDRKTWPEGLSAKRSAWDHWFARFMRGQGDLHGLNDQIDIVNEAKRPPVPAREPIAFVRWEGLAPAPIAVPLPSAALPAPEPQNGAARAGNGAAGSSGSTGAAPGFVPPPPPAPSDDEAQ